MLLAFFVALTTAAPCESLLSLTLPETTILSAALVPEGPFTPPSATATAKPIPVVAACRVVGRVNPAINFEVWMLASGWNGKFQAVGGGGFAGVISYRAMATALRRGYATASTDTGHSTPGGSWALGHPELVIDFGYRAIHEMTVKAKAIVEAMYHGWNDQLISPFNTINYYRSIVKTMGAIETDDFARLFMAPGMLHCAGGPGPNTFDALTALEQWVEQGRKPSQLTASHSTSGVVDRTRPLCPYPQVATYKGSGSIDEAASFICK